MSLTNFFFFNEMSSVTKGEEYCSLCRTGKAHTTLESSSQSIGLLHRTWEIHCGKKNNVKIISFELVANFVLFYSLFYSAIVSTVQDISLVK